ncbi:MAG: cytochrome c3 family protein, partial [Deferrisomatales bacterium]|nr:cytochrome c3 family protein [Deferrisomatales bacterium]
MRSMKILAIALAALGLAAAFGGCGSNLNSSDGKSPVREDFGTDGAGRALVGADRCVGCHEGFSWSAEAVADYLAGKHVIHSDHIEAASDSTCLACHDPVGDGPTLEALVDAANVPAGGLAAVTCEACHGAGGEHYGVGPMPTPQPDYTVCVGCHDKLLDNHLPHHPEADNIGTKFVASQHFTASVRNEAECAKCHTDEGGRLYKDVTTAAGVEAHVLPVEGGNPVQCRTCHNPHKAGGLLQEDVEDHGHVVASAEYATCVTCHMNEQADPADLMYHGDRHMRVISDTHYDDPATSYQSEADEGPATRIEGYVVVRHDDSADLIRACLDCHDVHAVQEIRADRNTTTINDQWAASGHAGHLMAYKKAAMQTFADADQDRTVAQTEAMRAAGPDGAQASWPHYDWDAADRQSCQRCHTATGSKHFLTDPATYAAANNDFSHLAGWANDNGTITSSGQNELLYCWACHANNTGALRNPGAITEEYDPAVIVNYPDLGDSNICMSCHLGRETGQVIHVTSDADGVRGFINSHYLSAGAQLFAEGGYEYAGRNYGNVSSFVHDQIGTATQPATGDGGPCVGCHMSTEESHLFLPVETDEATNRIT